MTQAGTGASPGYDAVDVRRLAEDPSIGEGVTTYDSFRVSQRGAGANQSVDVNMDQVVYVRGDAVTLQGIYPVPPHSATINETVTAADGTNPRIDQVVLEILDNTHDASGSNLARTRVIAGTPTGGATLDNRTGAAATPSSAMLLADVLVPAASSSVTNANIRDRRPFVQGLPPVLTDVDQVGFLPVAGVLAYPAVPNISTTHDLAQAAAACYLPRRIASATRIRWRYQQDSGSALTGNYVIFICDASGRKLIDTGSVALTGATSTMQARSETITATTFEPGVYYVGIGVDTTGGTAIAFSGTLATYVHAPNVVLRSTTGGVTAPTTVLGFTDASTLSPAVAIPSVPFVSLSVG